jgi:cellulose synthase/poly-beta-1,6-N-acetylglucosamine synthase-like glycosyltransferase
MEYNCGLKVTTLINNNEYNKVIIPAYNEEKAIANVINRF